MIDNELKAKLVEAKNLDEVKDLLEDSPDLDAEAIYREIQKHRSDKNELLDIEELDAVSGGADRDWVKDGCAATCEAGSWCGSNDYCMIWDVTYDNFWATCPDGHPHEFKSEFKKDVCVRCGFVRDQVPGGDPG